MNITVKNPLKVPLESLIIPKGGNTMWMSTRSACFNVTA